MSKYAGYIGIVALIVAVVALALPASGGQTIVEKVVGANPGPVHTDHQEFLQSFTKGGDVYATSSTAATYTLTSSELTRDVNLISWNAGLNLTLTTMASTSAPLADLAPGEELVVNFYSATTTAATTITFAAGTGVDLQEDEGETVVVNGLEMARLTFLKKADTDVIAWVEVGQVGD